MRALVFIVAMAVGCGGAQKKESIVLNGESCLQNIGELNEMYKDDHGQYTTDIEQLALFSGAPELFERSLRDCLHRPIEIEIIDGGEGYIIRAHAGDAARTPIEVQGPVE